MDITTARMICIVARLSLGHKIDSEDAGIILASSLGLQTYTPPGHDTPLDSAEIERAVIAIATELATKILFVAYVVQGIDARILVQVYVDGDLVPVMRSRRQTTGPAEARAALHALGWELVQDVTTDVAEHIYTRQVRPI
jgi:hypothetical protein